jgi:hypothetical protein
MRIRIALKAVPQHLHIVSTATATVHISKNTELLIKLTGSTSHETQNAQWQTPLKENCAKHKREEQKQKGKGWKVYTLPTLFFILILMKTF